ncbi:ATP-binding cassette domain-containing protein, partial [Clostridium perfringens]
MCKKNKVKQVLNVLSFNLEKGKVLVIMGPNGQGKTTLLNII